MKRSAICGSEIISVEVNVRGRDLASFVSAARQAITAQVKIPTGYQLEWSGQFEQLKSATQRLMIVVPAALTLIFVLLYFNFQAGFPRTAYVASLGFIPMAVSHSAGAEIQRPLATVVIGGLITSTLLTLLVLPTLYKWVEQRREAKGVQV